MDALELTSRLVAIESINPSLVPGGAGEAEIARFVARWARAAGLSADVLESTPGRPSVIVRAAGSGGGRTLLLCGHLDTVGAAGMVDALVARVEGDRLYGRGSYDMKAGLAACLLACREAARRGLRGDVVVAAVADEEHASLGVQEVLPVLRADAAIVTEPTELSVVVAHKGFVWSEITLNGVAAHGSRPHLGVDAIAAAGPVLTRLGELDGALAEHAHPLLGRGSVHASLIAGGAELSSYPARCVLSLERRTLPGETAAGVEAEVASLIGGADGSQRTLLVREPFSIDPAAEIVSLVRSAAGDAPRRGRVVLGRRRVHRGGRHPDRDVRAGRGGRARGRRVGQPRRHRDRGPHARRRRRGVLRVSGLLNPAYDPAAVPAPSAEALAFHRGLDGYRPTPLRDLGGGVWLKDESDRLGLPAFKVLGASWATERALRAEPAIHTLVAASAGNHGRAVAHVAALRGLTCRVYLPARAAASRRRGDRGRGRRGDRGRRDLRAGRREGRGGGRPAGLLRARRRRCVRPRALGDRRLRDALLRARRPF